MIKNALSAFLTGWLFSNLQFSFLMLLQINVSSAYRTYMLITLAWMAGTIAGLWIPRLTMRVGIVLGLTGYYVAAFLLAKLPFSPVTIPIAVLCVALAGLWAGRFFVVMFHRFKSADRIFFHENNGFILGGITLFIGFTLWGRPFLMAMPLILATALLMLHRSAGDSVA